MDLPVRGITSVIMAVGVLVGSAESLSAQAAAASGGQAAPPAIVAYRKAVMNTNTQHLAALRALSSGEIALPGHVRMHARALWENALLMAKGVGGSWELFPRESTHPTSRATAKIWTETEEFAWRLLAFQETTADLVQAAETGSAAQIRDAVARVQTTCGGCHASMRGPAPAQPTQ